MKFGRSGNQLTQDVIDWMHQGMLLIRSRAAANGMVHDPPEVKVRLRRELAIRECVWTYLRHPDLLTGDAAIWYHYMINKAWLQVARYAGEIEEKEFREEARRLRKIRDDRDSGSNANWVKLPEVA